MLLVFNFRLRSFEFSFWVLQLLSFTLHIFVPRDMEGLITGGFDDPHLEKLIMSLVRDSMKALSVGIFHPRVVRFPAQNVEKKTK